MPDTFLITAYLGLGSNVGDREANLRRAIALLRERVAVTAISPVYETEPVGYADQGDFLNCVARVTTDLMPLALLDALEHVEAALGKATPFRNGPRTIDLDLLLYGDEVIDTPRLQVPHPRMHQRRFVLQPLVDIAPDAVHPALGMTAAELLRRLPEGQRVQRYQQVTPLR